MFLRRLSIVVTVCIAGTNAPHAAAADLANLDRVSHILVIFLENRSFDNLFGAFPGANGVTTAAAQIKQRRLDGTVYGRLPQPEEDGPFDVADNPAGVQDYWLPRLPNAQFVIDGVRPGVSGATYTRDLVHRFYTNRAQIHGGDNDRYVAYSDAGGLTMGYYSARTMRKTFLWQIAAKNVLLDNNFQGAFGGSFLNHFWLVCACAPKFPGADKVNDSHGRPIRSLLDERGDPRAKDGDIRYGDRYVTADDGKLPGIHAVNTMQYQLFNDGKASLLLPPQSETTIGDVLTRKGIKWAWYSGGWTLANTPNRTPEQNDELGTKVRFQWHHQPFAAFERFNPATPEGRSERAEHLRDAKELDRDIASNRLPPVSFYKPAGFQNQHPGYSDIPAADNEVRRVVTMMQKSPMKDSYAIIVTYDEFGGFFDHVAPPMGAAAGARADYFGPGPRIATIVISPFVKHGTIDKRPYETTSILKLIADRFGLDPLPSPRFNAVDSLARVFEGP